MIIEVNNENFEEVVKKGKVVIDFWAPWCGPCKMLSPILEELDTSSEGLTIGKVNVDDNPDLAGKHGVMSIPMLLFFKDGQLKDSSIGVVSKNVLQNKIAALD
nr:thioredoxin 1 [Candidatus Cloacimonadota bacterium]